ncbi:MAG: class I SAM-dependent methyltransferase [Candidatus Eremiobacteraeota bacterium]|nr:class I SAM-dependent methyltransferase [Candidatus Eremiobacteraeota bacterium]
MKLPSHARRNQSFWDAYSDEYQHAHGRQLDWRSQLGWGVWDIPETSLRVLGDVAGLDVLELGCGAAQWSIGLALQGARPVALDLSERQLAAARTLMKDAGCDFPLVHASAEHVPLPDASFDIVFCDHGAMTFADPFATVPEASRLLRAGGLFAFNIGSQLRELCWDQKRDAVDPQLRHDYFGMHRLDDGETVVFQLPYGEWLRLFRRHGLILEDLIELQPAADAVTTYEGFVPLDWARRWPAENIWKLRKEGAPSGPR